MLNRKNLKGIGTALKHWYQMQKGQNFSRRCAFLAAGIFFMGFSMSFLILTDFGTDPIAAFSMGLHRKTGLSFGTCLLLFNVVWFLVVIFSKPEMIGIGTLANMVVLGYIVDLFSWIWKKLLPDPASFCFGLRIAILIPSVIIFVIAAAMYMTCGMGMSPDDAVIFICADVWLQGRGISLTAIRMIWDAVHTVLAFLLGGTIGAVTVLIVFTLGPAISGVRPVIERQIMKMPKQKECRVLDIPGKET